MITYVIISFMYKHSVSEAVITVCPWQNIYDCREGRHNPVTLQLVRSFYFKDARADLKPESSENHAFDVSKNLESSASRIDHKSFCAVNAVRKLRSLRELSIANKNLQHDFKHTQQFLSS